MPGGKVFGRGVVRYGSRDLCRIAGKQTDEIQTILGRKSHDEVIHRNDLVIWSER
jgi:glutamate 5-kinase